MASTSTNYRVVTVRCGDSRRKFRQLPSFPPLADRLAYTVRGIEELERTEWKNTNAGERLHIATFKQLLETAGESAQLYEKFSAGTCDADALVGLLGALAAVERLANPRQLAIRKIGRYLPLDPWPPSRLRLTRLLGELKRHIDDVWMLFGLEDICGGGGKVTVVAPFADGITTETVIRPIRLTGAEAPSAKPIGDGQVAAELPAAEVNGQPEPIPDGPGEGLRFWIENRPVDLETKRLHGIFSRVFKAGDVGVDRVELEELTEAQTRAAYDGAQRDINRILVTAKVCCRVGTRTKGSGRVHLFTPGKNSK